MVLVNWKSIDRLKFKELYPELLSYYKDGTLPTKSKSALTRFMSHTRLFTYDSGVDEDTLMKPPGGAPVEIPKTQGRIYLIADNLPDTSLKGIVELPIQLELINPSDENIVNIVSTLYNNSLVGGYRGVEPLFKKIKQSYLGVTRGDVENVLKKMELKQYQRLPAIKTLQTIITTRPMEQIQIDLIEVGDWAYFNDKTEYLMTIKDMYSKYAWCIPLKNKSCAVVAERLQNLFLVEGFPEILQTDNGGEFIGEEMLLFEKRYGIEVRHSLPYHSSTQGSIEKFNSTVRNMIHQYQADWKTKRYIDRLPFLMYSYNTTVHSTNRYTPFQVLRRKNEVFKLDEVVQKNIRNNAKKMIKKNLKSQTKELPPLKFGDKVRVEMKSTQEIRKLSEITKDSLTKKRHLFNYSKEIYTVIEVKEDVKGEDDELSVTKYRIDFEYDRLFFRSELLKVKVDELIELSHKSGDKPDDLTFGVRFNPEEHLEKLHSKVAKEENDMNIEELEEKVEEEEDERLLEILPKRDKPKKKDDMFIW